MNTIKFFKKEKGQLLFNGPKMEAYVKKSYFEKGINELRGDRINIYGLFNFRIGNAKGEIDPKSKLFTFVFPVFFITIPIKIETKDLELLPGTGIDSYYVLTYENNAVVMETLECVRDIDNIKCYIDLLISGSLYNTIKYEDIYRITMKVFEVNQENCGCPALLQSVIISELYRYKKDQSIPFRKAIGKYKNVTQLDYVANNTRSVAANNSTFSGLTFEDIDTMLVYAVNKKRYNKTENESPIEQLIKI